MLMIVGFVLAFIISALMVALLYWFINGIVDMPYLWHK